MIDVKFEGRYPVEPRGRLQIGVAGDNRFETLRFTGLPEIADSTAYLYWTQGDAGDVIALDADGCCAVTAAMMQASGAMDMQVRITQGSADADVRWNSAVFAASVRARVSADEAIAQSFPTAIEQGLARVDTAVAQVESIDATSEPLPEGSTPTAAMTHDNDGLHLALGVPAGATGAQGPQGVQGEPGADAPQIDDTQASATHPWSGSKTDAQISAAKATLCNALVGTASGTDSVQIADASPVNRQVRKLQITGNSTQQTYTGKNLYSDVFSDYTQSDAYYIKQIDLPAGTYKIKATLVGSAITGNVVSVARSGTTYPFVDQISAITMNGTAVGNTITVVDGDCPVLCVYSNRSEEVFNNLFANYNVQLESGSTATAYEPYVGGIPSPSPDYPQRIQNVGDLVTEGEYAGKYAVPVKVSGKNLLDLGSVSGTLSTNVIGSRSYPTAGEFNRRFRGKTLTISCKEIPSDMRIGLFVFGTRSDADGYYTSGYSDLGTRYKTFLIPDTVDFLTITQLSIRFYRPAGANEKSYTFEQIMLREGELSAYEPYVEPATHTLYLDAPLQQGDTLDVVGGEVQKTTKRKTFMSGSDVKEYSIENGLYLGLGTDYSVGVINSKCSHFKNGTYVFANNKTGAYSCLHIPSLRIPSNIIDMATAIEWINAQCAAGMPVTVEYELTTPVEIDISGQALELLDGVTTVIEVATDTPPSAMECKYPRDINAAIGELSAAIVALGATT